MKRIFTLLIFCLSAQTITFAQTQASAINFQSSGDGANTSLKINWTSGASTDGRIVVVKNSSGLFTPTGDISSFGANANFNTANDLDVSASGVAKVVYAQNGAGTSVTVSNLVAGTQYYVQIFEYTGLSGSRTYVTTTNATNPLGVVFYTANGSFNTPIDVTTITAQAWGGGGGGGRGSNGAAGGGGGAYASSTVAVAASSSHAITVGSGGAGGANGADGGVGNPSSFASSVIALGGAVTNSGVTGAAGGSGPGSTGTTKFSGGNGGNGGANTNEAGGGGGSSATLSGNGVAGSNFSGATGGAGGNGADGDGGKGGDDGVSNSGAGTFPGGGGGGRGDGGGTGGAGAAGLVIVSFKDAAAPTAGFTRLTPAGQLFNASPTQLTFRVTFNEDVANVGTGDFSLSFTNSASASIASVTANPLGQLKTYDVVINTLAGDGDINLDFGTTDIVDISGNAVNTTPTTDQIYTRDATPPTISIGAPSATIANAGSSITFTITYTGASSVNLTNGNITVNQTGANASVNVTNGTTNTPTVTLNSFTGNGSVTISIAANTAQDAVGNNAAGQGPSASVAVDTTVPIDFTTGVVSTVSGTNGFYNISNTSGISIAVPIDNDASLNGGTIQVRFDNAGGSSYSNLGAPVPIPAVSTTQNVPINNATLTAAVSEYADGNTLTFTVIITDIAGNTKTGTASATTVRVDKTAPTLTLTQPASSSFRSNSFVTYTISESLSAGSITWDWQSGTADTDETLNLAGTELTSNRTNQDLTSVPTLVDGAVYNVIFAGTDLAGNPATPITNTSVEFDSGIPIAFNTGTVATLTGGNVVSGYYNTTNTGGISIEVPIDNDGTLVNGTIQIQVDKDGGSSFQNLGSTIPIPTASTTQTVNISDLVLRGSSEFGDGRTLTFRAIIADRAGNPRTGANSGSTLIVDTTVPTVNIGAPSATLARASSSVTFGITYSGATTFDLQTADITVNSTGGASATAAVTNGNTSSATVTLNPFTNNGSVTITIAADAVRDVAGNPNASTGPSASVAVDTNVPAGGTVGTVAAVTNGRLVNLYFNGTNDLLSVVVPMSNSDASLDNGSVQLRMRMRQTGAEPFTNIPNSGLSTITSGQRGLGTKTINVSVADLITAGMTDGNFGGLRSAENRLLEITAFTTDLAGNSSADYTPGANRLDVDRTAPTITGPVKVIENGGGGNKEAILFNVTEPMSDHAATPAERGHDFQFIAADNAYGNVGISVDDELTDNVRYYNNGAVSTIDASYTNTRLIFVESRDNGPDWTVANGTNVRYVRGLNTNTTAAILRDPAGNQLVESINTVTAGAVTTIASASNGLSASPLINSANNQAVFAFSLTPTSNIDLTSLTINTTSNAGNLFAGSANIDLFSNTTADSYPLGASDLNYTPTVGASTITFSSISVPLTASTTRYFYLVVDVSPYFFSASPTITFSVANSDFVVSSGGRTGTLQTSANYVLQDNTPPSILSLNRTDATTFEGDLTQTVSIVYNEPMNNATTPNLSLSGVNWGAATGGAWSTTTLTNDTYTASFTHNGTPEVNAAATANIPASGTGLDWGGSANTIAAASPTFLLDNVKPTVDAITVSPATVTRTNNILTVTVSFSEDMRTSAAPVFNFSSALPNLSAGVPRNIGGYSNGWKTAEPNDTYIIDYTHNLTEEELNSLTVSVNGAFDAAGTTGNVQTVAGTSTQFRIDTRRPTVSSVNRVTSTPTNATSLSYQVTFSEAVTGLSNSDFTSALVSGSFVSTGTVTGFSTLNNIVYTVTVGSINGNGNIKLNVNTGGTIIDAYGNLLTVGFTAGQEYSVDQIVPTATSIDISGPTETWSTVNGTSAGSLTWLVTFSEPVVNVDETDFSLIAPGGLGYSFSPLAPGDVTGSGATRTVTLRNVIKLTSASTTRFHIDLIDNNSILDLAGNPLGGPVAGDGNLVVNTAPITYPNNDIYFSLFPEPVNALSTFVASAPTSTSFSINWNSTPEALIPQNSLYYFVEVKRSDVASFNLLNDGTYPFDSDYSDFRIAFLVSAPTARPIDISGFTGVSLNSGFSYDVRITPGSYSGLVNGQHQFNWFTAGQLLGSGSTTTAQATTLSSSFSAGFINSTVDESSTGLDVFNFTIDDDGAPATDGLDDAPFKFNFLTIRQGTGNDITNWTEAIPVGGATLTTPSGGTVVGTVFNDRIEFSGFARSGPTDFGFIPDNQSKTYTLRIKLRDNLGGTLPLIIDEDDFVFRISGSDIALDNTTNSRFSSQFLVAPSQFANSNNVPVQVTATAWAFTQQPVPTTVLVQTNFTTPPTAKAVDIHGNVDQGVDIAVSITNTGLLNMLPGGAHPTNLTAADGVVAFPAGFQYLGAGNGTLTVTGAGVNSNSGGGFVSCSAVTVNYSSLSTVTNGTGVVRMLSTITAAPGTTAFTFTYNDDGGPGLGDGANTRIDLIKITPDAANQLNWGIVLAGATLSDGGVPVAASSIDATGITFSGTAFTSSTLSTITDAASAKTYTLNVWFNSNIGALRTTADQDRLVFSMSTAAGNLTLNSISSQAAAPTTVTSDPGAVGTNGRYEVDATRLIFSSDFSGALTIPPVPPVANAAIDYLVNTSTSTQGFTNPVVRAVDIHGNTDTDYTAAVTTVAAGGIALTNPLTSINNGQSTFSGAFEYQAIGNGTLSVSTAVTNRVGAAVSATTNSQTVNVKTGTASRINSPAVAAASVSSVTNVSPGSTVFTFSIADDPTGTPVLQNDGNPTLISGIVITGSTANNTVTDWTQAIAGARLEDSGDPSKFVNLTAAQIGTASLTFTGIPNTLTTDLGYIADGNGSGSPAASVKTFNLRIWLKTNLTGANNYNLTIDGLRFGFDVLTANVSIVGTGTSLVGGLNANTTNVSTPVDVNATQLDILSPNTATNVSLNSNFSGIVVEARDANTNRDLDFNGIITDLTNTTNRTTINGPVEGTTAFTAGVYTFANNFQFTTGANGDDVTLTIKADDAGGNSGTNCGTNAICSGISPTLTLLTSFESSIQRDPTFTIPARIPYLTYQEATNIQNSSTSYELIRLLLVDGSRGPSFIYGGGATPNLNTTTDSGDGLANTDNDGAATVLTDLTVRIFKPSTLRRIALYANGTEVAGTEIDVTGIGAITSATASYDFVWPGANLVTAADNSETVFSIRVSFRNTSPNLNDRDNVQGQLIAATVGVGSQFFNGNPANSGVGGPYIAGLPPNTPGSLGLIDVVATSLDFVTPASEYAGTDEPLGATFTTPPLPATSAAIVNARDKFALLDVDFNFTSASVTVTGAGAISNNAFVNGVLNLNGMIYRNTGNGTLIVQAGGLNSSIVPADDIGNHIPGQAVDVVNVSVSAASIVTPTNLKGGTPGAILMGVTFTPQHATTTEPTLKRFIFSFKDNPYQTATSVILKNFKVRLGATDVTTTGATVTTGSSTSSANLDLVIVDWAGAGISLFDVNTGQPAPKTFFLVADVDVTAKIGTAAMTPQLIDGGYNTPTDKNIIITRGTARSTVEGQTYTFASTRPPVLLTNSTSLTRPFNGQLNVDKNLTQIQLEFDIPVWSLNGKAQLLRRSDNLKVADLNAANGNFTTDGRLTPTANPLVFDIAWLPGNSFVDDELYYVTIAQGSFDNLTNQGEGISDDGFNYFGGIASNSILFFKISSPNPPALSFTRSVFSNLSTGSFQTTFDQRGTGYYMVVPANSPKPTTSQITGSAYGGTVIYRGSFPITLVNTPQTTTYSAVQTANTAYDVWIFAKNDANPVNISTATAYGGSADSYAITGTTPTLRFTTPTIGNIRPGFQPDYSLCPDSFFTLTDPIIIGEINLNDFTAAGTQDFNILLPAGFEFDGVTKPTVTLEGTDFATIATITWVNNTILNISYQNTGAATRDKIVITNLRIKGTSGSNPGNIRRFAGTASIGSVINLATIANLNVAQQKFTNSFSIDNDFTPFGFASNAVITAIPDNYVDKDPNIEGNIRLIPQITPANDFGVTFFSGTGVTNDILSLQAVALNTAFDITMTHSDLNGCISENSVQYVVYDHTTPISDKLGDATGAGAGTQQALYNTNFPAAANIATIPNTALPRINYQDLAGYKLLSLRANIPTNASNQIIQGAAWQSQVAKIPKSVRQVTNDTDLPTALGFTAYNEYQWDYSHILNAVTETSGGVSVDPYDNFKETTANLNNYWTGGSLGKVEFTGTFQSTADLSLIVPFRQEVELFVPAIPLIEVDETNQPVKGTTNYCEFGGGINISGFPAAAAGTSTGTFAIFDKATNTPLQASAPNSAFVDNGNGTATIFPNLIVGGLNVGITNGYKTIVIRYTYQQNNSPAVGVGEISIRITPNPIADFTTSTLCEDKPVTFTDASPALPATGISVNRWQWNFGDVNSVNNTASTQNPTHIYDATGLYTPVTLNVVTNVGCVSVAPKSVSLQIGGTPDVAFNLLGVSTKDPFLFSNQSSVSANDSFKQLDWTFGDGKTASSTSNFATANSTYGTPGEYTVNLRVTSTIGCVNNLNKKIVVLDQVTPSPIAAYDQNFESNGANWQPSNLPFALSVQPPLVAVASSWAHGTPTLPSTIAPPLNTSKMWKTNLSGNHSAGEESALYSPSFDLSTLQRPMISFEAFFRMVNSAGVVLQYSIDDRNVADPAKTWFVLGLPQQGIDWYTDSNIGSKPGAQSTGDYGWSGLANTRWYNSKLAITNPNTPGNPLDDLVGQRKVVFRFAFASSRLALTNEGFALDNFRIGERTRTVLLESFANTANSDAAAREKQVNDFIKTFQNNSIGTNVIKMNYHVGFPGKDPFNQDNQADPSARALYYEVSKTPSSSLDGKDYSNEDPLKPRFDQWGDDKYNTQTLQLANADIFIHGQRGDVSSPPLIVENDGITFYVTVQAKSAGLVRDRTILHTAILEQQVAATALSQAQRDMITTGETGFEYIVKKMLPSAAGTRFTADLAVGATSAPFGPFTWRPDPTRFYTPNTGDLSIVAFVQDERTRVVYQTEIITNLNDPAINVVTGVETLLPEQVNVFPNPAVKEFTVELPGIVQNDIELQLVDQIGRVHPAGKIAAGKNSQQVDTGDLAEGIYILQIGGGGNAAVRKKIMILRKE